MCPAYKFHCFHSKAQETLSERKASKGEKQRAARSGPAAGRSAAPGEFSVLASRCRTKCLLGREMLLRARHRIPSPGKGIWLKEAEL